MKNTMLVVGILVLLAVIAYIPSKQNWDREREQTPARVVILERLVAGEKLSLKQTRFLSDPGRHPEFAEFAKNPDHRNGADPEFWEKYVHTSMDNFTDNTPPPPTLKKGHKE